MGKSVFQFNDYRSFLIHKLGPAGRRTGLRTKACDALGCHSTYLSQVLGGKTDLSLEYGEAFTRFLDLGEEDRKYFMLLLLRARAGSTRLEEHFQKQIRMIQIEQSTLKKQHLESSDISPADQDKFYSSWIYGALHVLSSLPHMKSRADLADALQISLKAANEATNFLTRLGLIAANGDGFKVGPRHVHLGSDSQLVSKHHTNWRFHAIQSLNRQSTDDLHYSGAISLSKRAAQEIREILLRSFKENMEIVAKAEEEVAYVYCFDFYRLDE